MAIPDYQTLMRPVLAQHTGGGVRSRRAVQDGVAAEFELGSDELEELLPSGRQSRFHNRVNWAVVYLVRAGLLRSPRRGTTEISPRGEEMLQAHPDRIDNPILDQFPEFVSFDLEASLLMRPLMMLCQEARRERRRSVSRLHTKN